MPAGQSAAFCVELLKCVSSCEAIRGRRSSSNLACHEPIFAYAEQCCSQPESLTIDDYDMLLMDPAIEAFEALASRHARLIAAAPSAFDDLVHPVHRGATSALGSNRGPGRRPAGRWRLPRYVH